MDKPTVHVVNVSGGKDSTATALLCLDAHPRDSVRLLFADTGNEHPLTMEYLDYLREKLGPIDVVRGDFSDQIARRRERVLTKWTDNGVPQSVCDRIAAVLTPTGNPYLDLCLWKGRFPSRLAQFCTQELKRYPLDKYMLELISREYEVENWQGIRRDESTRRADSPRREQSAEGWWVNRPIVDWTAQQTVDFVTSREIKLNPLYSLGFLRVGCAPCINSGKDDLALWAQRFPEMIDKITEWEECVSKANTRGRASFFSHPVREHADWAKTAHGGREYDLIKSVEPSSCFSIWGLCE